MGRGLDDSVAVSSKKPGLLTRSVFTREESAKDLRKEAIANPSLRTEEEISQIVERRVREKMGSDYNSSFLEKLRASFGSGSAREKLRIRNERIGSLREEIRKEEEESPFQERKRVLEKEGVKNFSPGSPGWQALREPDYFSDAYSFTLSAVEDDLLREDGDNFALVVTTTSLDGNKKAVHQEFVGSAIDGRRKAKEVIKDTVSKNVASLQTLVREAEEERLLQEKKRKAREKDDRERKVALDGLELTGVSYHASKDMHNKYRSLAKNPDNYLFDPEETKNLTRKDFGEWTLLSWSSVRTKSATAALFLRGKLQARTQYGDRHFYLCPVERDSSGQIVATSDEAIAKAYRYDLSSSEKEELENKVIDYIKEWKKEEILRKARES
jgi:hypothetical protein